MSGWVGDGVALCDEETEEWVGGLAHVYPLGPMPDMEHDPGAELLACYPCEGCWCCSQGICRQVVTERHDDGSPAVVVHGTPPRA